MCDEFCLLVVLLEKFLVVEGGYCVCYEEDDFVVFVEEQKFCGFDILEVGLKFWDDVNCLFGVGKFWEIFGDVWGLLLFLLVWWCVVNDDGSIGGI